MDKTARYTSAQKAVAALVAIGKPQAATLLKLMSHAEIARLHAASKTMTAVTQQNLESIVNEFEDEFAAGTGLLNSNEQINAILSESFAPDEMSFLQVSDIAATTIEQNVPNAWNVLESTENDKIAVFLASENPQVAAFVVSRLPSSKAAQVLGLLGRENRALVLSRMMNAGEVSKDVEAIVEGELISQFARATSTDGASGLATVANILNELDRELTDEVLADLSATVEPDRISTVSGMLFRFDDVVNLDAASRTRLFDVISTEMLTLALRGASPDVVEAALSAISQRSRRMIESDLKSGAPSRPDDISIARKKIVGQVMRLSADGQLDLPKAEQVAA